MTDNIILFPKSKKGSPPQTVEEIQNSVTQLRLEHINEMMEVVVPNIVDIFENIGIIVHDHEYIKDVALLLESIKSLIYKYNGLNHSFHELADNIFQYTVQDDESVAYTFTLPTKEEE